MSGKASRDKGKRGEYLLRDVFRQMGYESHRVPCSGAAQGFKGDLRITKDGITLFAELKVRQNEFKSIYGLLDKQPGTSLSITSDGNACFLSYDFNALCFSGANGERRYRYVTFDEEKRTIKKIFNLRKLVQGCDFLVLKIDRREFIYLRFL